MKKNVILTVLAVVVPCGVLVVLAYVFLSKKKTVTPGATSGSGGNTTGTTQGNSTGSIIFPLGLGSKGEVVKEIQVALNSMKSRSSNKEIASARRLTVDGVWGSSTASLFFSLHGQEYIFDQGELNKVVRGESLI